MVTPDDIQHARFFAVVRGQAERSLVWRDRTPNDPWPFTGHRSIAEIDAGVPQRRHVSGHTGER